jgi:methionine aminopeptidase
MRLSKFFSSACHVSSDHAGKYKFGVVRQFVGHGVGRFFHADPVVLHFSECSSLSNLFL